MTLPELQILIHHILRIALLLAVVHDALFESAIVIYVWISIYAISVVSMCLHFGLLRRHWQCYNMFVMLLHEIIRVSFAMDWNDICMTTL